MRVFAFVCLLGAVALASLGCNQTTYGLGIGVPGTQYSSPPTRESIAITEVALSSGFFQLKNTGTTAIDLAGQNFFLCTTTTNVEDQEPTEETEPPYDCVALSGTIDAGSYLAVPQQPFSPDGTRLLNVTASVGAIALVRDPAGQAVVDSYFAWGADPSTWGSGWLGPALCTGATTLGSFIALPWPMPANVAVASDNGNQGCTVWSSPGDSAPVIDMSQCSVMAPPIRLSEVRAHHPDIPPPIGQTQPRPPPTNDSSWIEIENTTQPPTPVSLFGVRLCHLPDCIVFDSADVINVDDVAKKTTRFFVTYLGIPSPTILTPAGDKSVPGAAQLLVGLDGGLDDDIVLAAPGAPFELPVAPVGTSVPVQDQSWISFLRCGSTTGAGAEIAFDLGLWDSATAAAPTPTDPSTQTLVYDPTVGPFGSAAWKVTTTPTPGATNTFTP